MALIILSHTIFAQISLSEICSKNTNSLIVNGMSPDWIELYNVSSTEVNLQGYKLSDDKDEPIKWTFPSIIIPPNGYLLVLADGEDRLDSYVHTNFKLSDGESLILSDVNGDVIEEVEIPSLSEDITFSVINGVWKKTFPSPNSSNQGNELPIIEKPTFSKETGIYLDDLQLTISASGSNSRVEYYINDLKGLQKSETNSITINIQSDVMICARADADDKEQSSFECHSYIIGIDHELPILSIIADHEDIFDPEKGLFELGPNAETEWPHLGANFWSDRSEEVYFQYFNHDGPVFHGHADLEMHGGRQARNHPQKTFKLLAKAKYNQEFFQFPFFSNQPNISKYKRLVVRNASGDYNVANCRDGFLQNHVSNSGLDIDGTSYQPIAVYINGNYYGLMGLREKLDKYYTESHYSTQNIDLLEEEKQVIEGDSITFNTHLNFLMENDLSTDQNYQIASSFFDINSLIDYFHTQVINSNADWPRNNIKFWREKNANSKWRYIMFDLDAALGRYGWTEADDPMLSSILNSTEETSTFVAIMKAFLTNEKFKLLFYNRHQDLLNTTFSSHTLSSAFDILTHSIDSEMSRHVQKWPTLTYTDWKNIELEKVKTYIADRPNIAMDQMESYFSLEGRYNLSLTSNESGISFHLNSLDNVVSGFSGQYFKNIPITVSPDLSSNMDFLYWEITTENQTTINDSETLHISFSADTELKAIFDGVSTNDLVRSLRISQKGLHFEIILKGNLPLQYDIYDITGNNILTGVRNNLHSGIQSLDLEYDNYGTGLKIIHLQQGTRSYTTKIFTNK